MANLIFSQPKHCNLIFLLLLVSGGSTKLVHEKLGVSEYAVLSANLNWACTQVNCSVPRAGRPCFYTLMNHASVAMNLYDQAKGRNPWNCVFKDSALVVVTDPSYGNCIYPFL